MARDGRRSDSLAFWWRHAKRIPVCVCIIATNNAKVRRWIAAEPWLFTFRMSNMLINASLSRTYTLISVVYSRPGGLCVLILCVARGIWPMVRGSPAIYRRRRPTEWTFRISVRSQCAQESHIIDFIHSVIYGVQCKSRRIEMVAWKKIDRNEQNGERTKRVFRLFIFFFRSPLNQATSMARLKWMDFSVIHRHMAETGGGDEWIWSEHAWNFRISITQSNWN